MSSCPPSPSPSPPPPERCVVRPPFDDDDADIIIRSSDGIEFHLYKAILAKASSVFKDMFTLPENQPRGGPQVVDVTEDSDTLEALLRFCYPIDRPAFRSLDKLMPVLLTAKKYDMPSVMKDLRRSMNAFLHTVPPLQLYTVACVCELPELVRSAARLLLNDPNWLDPATMPPEFRVLPCKVLYDFAVYRKKCLKAALALVDDEDWLLSGDHSRRLQYSNKGNPHRYTTWIWLFCESCERGRGNSKDGAVDADPEAIWAGRKSGGGFLYPRAWWTQYIARVKKTLAERPVAKVVVDDAIVEPSLDAAAECSTCAPKARQQLLEFTRGLERRIQEACDKIELELSL